MGNNKTLLQAATILKPKYFKLDHTGNWNHTLSSDASTFQHICYNLNHQTLKSIEDGNDDIFDNIEKEVENLRNKLANQLLLIYPSSKPEDLETHQISNNIVVIKDSTCGSSLITITGDTSLRIMLTYALD